MLSILGFVLRAWSAYFALQYKLQCFANYGELHHALCFGEMGA